jgi:hypothetical protein
MGFKKGAEWTGNAKGRPKGSKNKTTSDIRLLFQTVTAEAFETLCALMRGAEDEKVQLDACKVILDRGHGRPVQTIDQTTTVHHLDDLTDEQLADFIAAGGGRDAVEEEGDSPVTH